MLIGHFAVGLAAKRLSPDLNLGVLFFACQLMDFIWPLLVLAGIEHVSVDMSATAVTPLNFSHYPYSHSLVMALLYSLIFGFLFAGLMKSKWSGFVAGIVVLSHWFLDFITHRPDLPLLFEGPKVGLGLWFSVWGTAALELTLFFMGLYLYLKAKPLPSLKKSILFWSLILLLLSLYAVNISGVELSEDTPGDAIAGPALAMWLIVLWAYFADRAHVSKHGR